MKRKMLMATIALTAIGCGGSLSNGARLPNGFKGHKERAEVIASVCSVKGPDRCENEYRQLLEIVMDMTEDTVAHMTENAVFHIDKSRLPTRQQLMDEERANGRQQD